MFLGAEDGADGMAFVLQRDAPDALGLGGGGVGAEEIGTAFGFKLDTWSNPEFEDPEEDFSRFFSQGQTVYDAGFDEDGPTLHPDLEDGRWHRLEVEWNAASKVLSYSLDGEFVDGKAYDVVQEDFGGVEGAWFGVTAATGGAANVHQVAFDGLFIS